jgi:hypothetical protein
MRILAKIKNGTIQFDMENGCSVRQQLDVDRSVVNPPQVRQGSVTYKSRFIETYLREENSKKPEESNVQKLSVNTEQ